MGWVASKLAASRTGRFVLMTVLLAIPGVTPESVRGQEQQQAAPLVRVDSIAVEGNARITRDQILGIIGFAAGEELSRDVLQAAEKALWKTGDFRDIAVRAEGDPDRGATIIFEVEERPLVRRVVFQGLERIDGDEVRDSAGLRTGQPFNEATLKTTRELVRSMLADEGVPFPTVRDEVRTVENLDNVVDILVEVNEGNRVAIAEVVVRGNDALSDGEIISAMSTRPEGFWWFEAGGYDQEGYDSDLQQALPELYAQRGYLDFQVLSDTLLVDPETGKVRVELDIDEGRQYRIARFDIQGNTVFEDDELEPLFRPQESGLLQSLGLGGTETEETEQLGRVFNRIAFDAALNQVRQRYRNQGYLFAQVAQAVDKLPPDSAGADPAVAVTIQVREGNPAYFGEIHIEGNDYTHDWVIRDQILIIPGQTYSESDLLRSYQSIQSLGFFQTPLDLPTMEPNPETGQVDVTFYVTEKNTGAVNFGTSVGGGVGLSGFIGYDQPNLFGQAKAGSVRWDFGRFINNFTLSYQDPSLFRSRISGQIQLFNSTDRFIQFQSGRRRRIGGSLRFGFPIPGWRRTRIFTGYSLSETRFTLREGVDDPSVFGLPPGTQSEFTLALTRSTLNHPIFPTAGSRQSVDLAVTGGVLGGDDDFQKITANGIWRIPLGTAGGSEDDPGSAPLTFSMGLALRTGTLFGEADNFPFDRFWMGGVQFGEQLRGYDETSVTPFGFFPERGRGIPDINRLGDAFFSMTGDFSMKLSDNIQVSSFFDAGNVWLEPSAIDPTRLFRGAGFGLQLVTPFGPVGVDYAYGFDKPQPGWQFHFRMGPGF